MKYKAILFGSIGTLIESSNIQRNSFNEAFKEAGLDWYWDEQDYKILLKKSGGTKRVEDFAEKIELSTDLSLIQEILFNEKTPKNTKLIFGHAAWDKNQLKEEIERGDWLIQEYSDSVFKSSPKDLWNELINMFGLDNYGFVGTSGIS